MEDDKELTTRCGKENPFKTPEGYFTHFHEQLMQSLPEVEVARQAPQEVTLMMRIKPLLYMAAMFVGTVFLIQGLMYIQDRQHITSDSMLAEELYTDEVDHFMSSSLYNEYALYSYLVMGE